MTARHLFSSFLFLTIALAAPGCALDGGNAQVHDDAFSVGLDTMGGYRDPTELPPGSSNGWLPACFWNTHTLNGLRQYATKSLWTDPQTGNIELRPNAEIDALSPECRTQALQYMIRCALPQDTYVVDPQSGEKIQGWLSIAPRWAEDRLNSDDEWWMTSCLTQHLNGFGAEIDLEVDGVKQDANLQKPGADDPNFPWRDSHTYGNIFNTAVDVGRVIVYACHDKSLGERCASSSDLNMRICDDDPTIGCNLVITGACETACTWSMTEGAYSCGAAGFRTIGSRLKSDEMYRGGGAECRR